jgi:MYXO-CTERM domain-containing protein
MTDNSHRTLERIARGVPVPEPAYERLLRRRDRKARNRRISAAALAIAIAVLSISGLMRAFRAPQRPATKPSPTGIFSGLGGWIAYGDANAIWATDPERQGVRKQLSTYLGEPLAWSSDGSKLLILRQIGDASAGRGQLYVLNADGSQTLLVDAAGRYSLSGGSFSPDGSQVVYARGPGVYTVDAEGGTPRLLLSDPPRLYPIMGRVRRPLFAATFSPDGSQIAYFAGWGDHDNTLMLMNAQGKGSRVLWKDDGSLRDWALLGSLVWSPDGKLLAFDAGYVPDTTFVIGVDGSGPARLIGPATNPHWSPDGSRISYNVVHDPLGPIAIANADGTHVQSFGFGASGPWNPLPRTEPATRGVSATAGAGGSGWPTYAIALLAAVGLAVIWRRRKHKRSTNVREEIE